MNDLWDDYVNCIKSLITAIKDHERHIEELIKRVNLLESASAVEKTVSSADWERKCNSMLLLCRQVRTALNNGNTTTANSMLNQAIEIASRENDHA